MAILTPLATSAVRITALALVLELAFGGFSAGATARTTTSGASGRVILPPIARRTLGNGLVVVLAERHSVPTVAVTVMVRAGAAQNSPDRPGTADLLAEMLTLGTKGRSAEKIAETIDSLGATLLATSTYDASTLTLTGLASDTRVLLDLAADMTRSPAFPSSELTTLKARRAGALRRQIDNPSTLADRAFQKSLFGSHPYARPADGTLKSLDAITEADLEKFYGDWYAPGNAVIAVVGDVSAQTTMPEIERMFGSWPKRQSPAAVSSEPAAMRGTKILVVDKPDLTQGQIRIGRLGVQRSTPDWYALQLANYMLGGGGFSSRLVKRIRSEKGLTYSIGSSFAPRRMTGPFTISTSTPNASVGVTVAEALSTLTRFRTEGPSEQELADAKSFYLGGFPLSLETPPQVAQQLLNIELFGLPADYLVTFQDRMAAVTAADVKRVSDKYLDPASLVIVVASKAADVKEALTGFGTVEVVPFSSME